MNTVYNFSHDAGSMTVSSLFFFSYVRLTLITVDNIYHSQNVSSNRRATLTVTCSHSAKAVEFRYGFKLLRLALRFHIFPYGYRVNATPKRKSFLPFSYLCRHRVNGGLRIRKPLRRRVQMQCSIVG